MSGNGSGSHTLTAEGQEWKGKFWDAVHNDLDLPTALAITWAMVRSDLPRRTNWTLSWTSTGCLAWT